ncbi:MAG: undecaprenyl-diphosphate phosphatase [Oceanococcus sp.]|nr:MAG: undecaprenyl-diphosphate phosphatase [Oceanococcus sp.]
MDALHAVLLGLIQGLTEFLPISSSGHLVLTPLFMGWEAHSLAFDVAVHFGTLVAVVAYFRRDLMALVPAAFEPLTGRGWSPHARMAWGLVVATIPASLVGMLIRVVFEAEIDSPIIVAINLIVFALLLWWADTRLRGERSEMQLGWGQYFLLGCAQALALIPGTSRSGVTMTAGMAMGLSRVASARVSFLMAVPVIALAAAYELLALLLSDAPAPWLEIAIGTSVAFVSGLACIHFLLRLLQSYGFMPFVIYRLILGGVILVLFW